MFSNNSYRGENNSFISILLTLLMIILAIAINGNIIAFIDISSILIVFVGTFFATSACFTWKDLFNGFGIIRKYLHRSKKDLQDVAYFVLKISDRAYKKGIIAISNQYEDDIIMESEYLWEGVKLAADNANPEFIEHTLGQSMSFMAERHKKTISILKKAADIAPAMGLIGTLIGLVQMLGNMSDVSKIGPAMSVALLTTFYGAVLSYVVLFPLASKLEYNTMEEIIIKKIYLEAAVSISKKDNPRMLEVVINNLLPSDKKIDYFNSNYIP